MLFRVPWGAGTGEAGLLLDAREGTPVDSPFSRPSSLFVDRAGYVLLCDPINFRVLRFSPKGKFDRAFRVPPIAGNGKPRLLSDVAATGDGRVAILDFTEGTLHLTDLDGRFSRFETPPGTLCQPVAFAASADEFAFYDLARRGTVVLAADGSFRRLYPEASQVHGFAGTMAGIERRGDTYAVLLYGDEETPVPLFSFDGRGLDYAEGLACDPAARTITLCVGGAGFREARICDFTGVLLAGKRFAALSGRAVRDVVCPAANRFVYMVETPAGMEIHEEKW